ncbi:hypothetical protein SAMN05660964_02603 [Thiothrix caldifontis]|uniref:Lipoprotein n=1 Tax=Thiothrix caldifontis TaxID=525918 RepID=A0A1H4EGN7_9GAMM|nr:hypothetical protein [Thiothrix caldifontis]SEA84234.1 hypothetical protein SAMN05660964_02603 [Thiothrix caldifontis]
MHYKNIAIASLLVTQLTACGGGSSDSGGQIAISNTAYTGSRELAPLNTNNQAIFAEGVFISITNITKAVTAVTGRSATSKNQVPPQNNQARSIDVGGSCPSGGTQRVIGELDNINNTGTLQITSTQCNTGSGVIDGVLTITVNAFDAALQTATDFTMSTSNLSEIINGISYSTTGSVHYTENTSTGELRAVSTLLRKSNSGSQLLDNNLQLVTNNNGDYLSGGMCENANGCVKLSTLAPFIAINGTPMQGEIVIEGNNGGKLHLRLIDARLWMGLDANGDGTDESTTQYITQ